MIPTPGTPALLVDDVTVRYDTVLALQNVTLKLEPGRVCGLVGTNGSGKSTLFKTIMGLVKPTSGQVTICGTSPAVARRRTQVAYVPQAEAVDWNFPIGVREVVMTGRYGHQGFLRRPRPADHEAVDAALERVGMTALAGRQIGQLSGGQVERNAGEIEPFAGVDATTEHALTGLIRELAAGGHAILVATHDLAGLARLCDEAVLLQRQVLVHGAPDEILRPENLARAFGAPPPVNSVQTESYAQERAGR